MLVGFTGTQRGMTEAQWAALWPLLRERAPGDFHHGDCINADAQAAYLARQAGFRVIGHPPINESKRAFFPSDENWPAAEYLDRNKTIVRSTEQMIATPGEVEEQLRSGTWSTIRYARRIGRPLHVILPDGRLL